MSLEADLTTKVNAILRSKWETRDGQVVPEAESVKLGNSAVILEGTVLYADLAGSTKMVESEHEKFAAEIYKSYLLCAASIIKDNDGFITAYDGDRVMAVFIGNSKNSNAAKTALKINYAVTQIINPRIAEEYPNSTYRVHHGIGIDTSRLFVARTGVRGANDLVWVGRAANYAAKLCSLKADNYATIITKEVFDRLSDDAKNGGNPKRLMWDEYTWKAKNLKVYRSNWWWKLE